MRRESETIIIGASSGNTLANTFNRPPSPPAILCEKDREEHIMRITKPETTFSTYLLVYRPAEPKTTVLPHTANAPWNGICVIHQSMPPLATAKTPCSSTCGTPLATHKTWNPLDAFYRSFPTFQYDPSLPPATSYASLRRHGRSCMEQLSRCVAEQTEDREQFDCMAVNGRLKEGENSESQLPKKGSVW